MERWSLFSPSDLRRYMVRINVSNILPAYFFFVVDFPIIYMMSWDCRPDMLEGKETEMTCGKRSRLHF